MWRSLYFSWLAFVDRHDARTLVTAVYGSFTEGFDTIDLREARALLDGLACGRDFRNSRSCRSVESPRAPAAISFIRMRSRVLAMCSG